MPIGISTRLLLKIPYYFCKDHLYIFPDTVENIETVKSYYPYAIRLILTVCVLCLLQVVCYAQPANDLVCNAQPLTSGAACTNVAGTMNNATVTGGSPAGCGGTVRYDVWYVFTAQSTNPSIRLSSVGATFNTPRIQLFTGTCGALTAGACNTATTIETSSLNLVVGTIYYIRVFSTVNPIPTINANFNICIVDPPPPANDLCANAIPLPSGTTCVNTAGDVSNASYTGASGATACAGTDRYDIWYTFVAQVTNPNISITGAGAGFMTPRIQVLSGTCGSFTSVGCGTNSYTPTGLTIGNTYYVRVYSTNNPIPANNGGFNICITNPPPPGNDLCAGATLLTSATACNNTGGTLLNATGTAGIPGDCGAVGSPEVWYRFVAQTPYPHITLSGVGAQFNAAGTRIQLLSGTCGSFTSLLCTGGLVLSAGAIGGTGLTVGNTYYIRVYTNSAVQSGTSWGFNICVQDPNNPLLDWGKSYVNITKGINGGTIEPGDELEIRAVFTVRTNSAFNVSFIDNLPSNTTYVPGTMRILTNEGKIYQQWTDAADSDPATISGSTVTINMGRGATGTLGGMIRNTDRPSLFNSTCVMLASYHVTVNAVPYDSPISVGGGTITYASPNGNMNTITFPAVTAVVYRNYGICANTVGSNGIISESGGTFGSGTLKDRPASGKVPNNYAYVPFGPNAPADYFYGLTNNTSTGTAPANYSIDPNDPVAAHRVFGVWEIIGDHTGAADPLLGNPPADVNAGQSGGYMVVINAAYRTDTAFLDTILNLCPNTSYEYSAWFRNVCPKCGNDSLGRGPADAGYVPTGPGDSSGVHPNLTFNINGRDYYTSGDIMYTNRWIKKGFTYRTGPAETQMVINIRNNAPGGGGNDWAIDDIGVATCSPTLQVNPATPQMVVCLGDGASLSAEVVSYFDNYTHYTWERSADSGATWTGTGYAGSGTITPVFNGTEYEYTAAGPSFLGDSTVHNNLFRLRVATTATNLADTACSFRAFRTVQVRVNNCMWVLKTDFVRAAGVLQNNLAVVEWKVENETDKVTYEIERSADGRNFSVAGRVAMNALAGSSYVFNDPRPLTGVAYYRIKLSEGGSFRYSKIIPVIPDKLNFAVEDVVNPFNSYISCNVVAPGNGTVAVTVADNYGRIVKTYQQNVNRGVNTLNIANLHGLSVGMYTLQVSWQNETISKRIVRVNK
jgi:hypothetical protein